MYEKSLHLLHFSVNPNFPKKKKKIQKCDPFIIYKNPSHSKSNKDIYTELCIVKYLQYRKPFKESISLHSMIKEVHLTEDINNNNMGGHKTLCPTLFIVASNSSWIMKSDLLLYEN